MCIVKQMQVTQLTLMFIGILIIMESWIFQDLIVTN